MQKNIKIYIYIADASADASLPRFLENDASASPLPKNAPASCNIGLNGRDTSLDEDNNHSKDIFSD